MKSVALLLIATGVIAGAFGAHLLKETLTPERLEVFKTAVFYQISMSIVLLILSGSTLIELKYPLLTTCMLCAGIFIFSGSLYLLVLLNIPVLGAITPIGGTFIILSLLLAAATTIR